jgi:transposase
LCLLCHLLSSNPSGTSSPLCSPNAKSSIRSDVTGRGSPIVSCFDKRVQVLVLGAAYERLADSTCLATTIRNRRDEWIAAGVFEALEQICLEAYDRIVGLDLAEVSVDGCIVNAPCGGEARRQIACRQGQARHETFPAR